MAVKYIGAALILASLAACATNAPRTPSPQDGFIGALQSMCGKAYAGKMVTDHPNDADLKGKAMIMHVRTCDQNGVRIPLHVEDDRSRTWVVTRTKTGEKPELMLKHDHRHKDGSEDTITQYGGVTATLGSATRQEFPADPFSKTLFEATGRPNSSLNTWAMEIIPGQRFIYEVTRPNRHVRFEFDLSTSVAAPPPPWGSAD